MYAIIEFYENNLSNKMCMTRPLFAYRWELGYE